MLISSSSRYSIYKVQTLSRSSQRLSYLSTSCRICQVLFYKFFKFFCAVRCAPGGCRSSHNFDILSQNLSFVKNFFDLFQTFFLLTAALAGNSHILAPVTPFVKHYFTYFAIILPSVISTLFRGMLSNI